MGRILALMAQVFAQHASAGIYHLETRYVGPNRWEWFVLDAQQTRRTLFSGDATTLEGAKKDAAMHVGLYAELVNWMPIGPAIEVPD
jgi:hypothetical protein